MHSPLRPSASALPRSPSSSCRAWRTRITLTNPPARHPPADQKDGPCGNGLGDSRTTDPAKITEYAAGETITIEFTETIQHASTYRVMLSRTGDGGFINPTGFEDTTLDEASGELKDGIEDLTPLQPPNTPEDHSIEVTLPSEPCEECTLQLIQVMREGPSTRTASTTNVLTSSSCLAKAGAPAALLRAAHRAAVETSAVAACREPVASLTEAGARRPQRAVLLRAAEVRRAAPAAEPSSRRNGEPGLRRRFWRRRRYASAMPPGCSLSGGMQAGSGADFGGMAYWLGLAGLGWLAFRRRRAAA